MIQTWKKAIVCLLAGVLSLALLGCMQDKPSGPVITVPSRGESPILPGATNNTVKPVEYTPVYATAFGDTVVLSTVPVEEWDAKEPECPAREISNGGRICCNGEHEQKTPITKVVILEDLIPKVTAGWFRDMVKLQSIRGLEMLHTQGVTDMSYMFCNCESLSGLDLEDWDVSKVTKMTAMFDGCTAMDTLPTWYKSE